MAGQHRVHHMPDPGHGRPRVDGAQVQGQRVGEPVADRFQPGSFLVVGLAGQHAQAAVGQSQPARGLGRARA